MKTTPLAKEQKQWREARSALSKSVKPIGYYMGIPIHDDRMKPLTDKSAWEDVTSQYISSIVLKPYQSIFHDDCGISIHDRRVFEKQIDGFAVMRDPKTQVAYDCVTGEKINM